MVQECGVLVSVVIIMLHKMSCFFCSFSAPCTNGDVELFGSSVARAGIVRVCMNGEWGKVCDGWRDPYFASIVCSQLGFSPYGMWLINSLQ